MEDVSLTETESRYFGDLFLCCDEDKTGKIPMLKAKELYRSANLADDVIDEITSLAGIPDTALHISRAQFYSCLKLIAAQQVAMPLRQELLVATVALPLPRFSWKESPHLVDVAALQQHNQLNGLNANATPPLVGDRRNSSVGGAGSRRNSAVERQQQLEAAVNSDVPSTDSEIEQNESSCGGGGSGSTRGDGGAGGSVAGSSRDTHHRRRVGSPEAWSTNSDSPTPTNSVAERPWAKETLWQGLLGDEHRQLLGTEEESSDRHSSDDDNNENDLVYQITPEQRDYYNKQFKAVQHDCNGLLSGQVARVFFEKSRIPVEELRHIWQLCDVTRDGALSLAEFTAAMHLVVLRRNNIPLPPVLPTCLHPSVLQQGGAPSSQSVQPQEPPEADLLHLNDDEDEDNTDNTIVAQARAANEKNVMNLSTLSTSSQASTGTRQGGGGGQPANASLTPPPLPPTLRSNNSVSNSPSGEPAGTPPALPPASGPGAVFASKGPKDRSLWTTTEAPPTQWTKFTESPTSNVSSPGPKPVNFDMQRTAQAVVSDPQILHPVPLRVTPVAGASANTSAAEMPLQEHDSLRESPKQMLQQSSSSSTQSNDLRAIQRPQAKKLPVKNIGALPPPPQRESSIGSVGGGTSAVSLADGSGESSNGGPLPTPVQSQQQLSFSKKEPPPLPPPRPHRHGRSSSLDLNKLKMSGGPPNGPQPEMTAQASFDLQTSTGFADFTNFPDGSAAHMHDRLPDQQQHSLPPQMLANASTATANGGVAATAVAAVAAVATTNAPIPPPATAALPPTRLSLQSNQRVSAFEVYRKPQTPRNSQSPTTSNTTVPGGAPAQPPPPAPFGAAGAAAIAQHVVAPPAGVAVIPALPNSDLYEKRVNAISETLRHVTFKPDGTGGSHMGDVLRHLREQNNLLLHLCNDLSDELLTVQTRKEEMRIKLDAATAATATVVTATAATVQTANAVTVVKLQPGRTGSSISAPVTANITGGSGSSGVHSNM